MGETGKRFREGKKKRGKNSRSHKGEKSSSSFGKGKGRESWDPFRRGKKKDSSSSEKKGGQNLRGGGAPSSRSSSRKKKGGGLKEGGFSFLPGGGKVQKKKKSAHLFSQEGGGRTGRSFLWGRNGGNSLKGEIVQQLTESPLSKKEESLDLNRCKGDGAFFPPDKRGENGSGGRESRQVSVEEGKKKGCHGVRKNGRRSPPSWGSHRQVPPPKASSESLRGGRTSFASPGYSHLKRKERGEEENIYFKRFIEKELERSIQTLLEERDLITLFFEGVGILLGKQ